MNRPTETRSENYLRFRRRSMIVTLAFVLVAGAASVAMAIWPATPAWQEARRPLQLFVIVLAFWAYRTLGGKRWDPKAAEARAIVADEWRRTNMNRARRVALAVVLAAQIPMALVLTFLPPSQALMAMAATTITLGLATTLALFLYFDREEADGG